MALMLRMLSTAVAVCAFPLCSQLLGQVCSAAQQGGSLQPVLQPVQQLKPVCGGPGWDAEVGQALRLLNFQVGAGQSCAELEE